jgi:hypothetical protein
MNQKSYIEDVFKRFNMKECKPVGIPFDTNLKLLKLSDEEFENVLRKMEGVPYKAGVGSLMYATVTTKANIAFAMSTVSQFMSNADLPHWIVLKYIMRKLKGT